MKIVSFEVAKAIKKAGYPQGITQGQYAQTSYYDNELEHDIDEGTYTENFIILGIDAPTYMEVWLWLFNEKNIIIEPKCCIDDNGEYYWENGWIDCTYYDAEAAVIAAIEYLVDNNKIY